MPYPETSRASRHPFRVAIPAFACALTLAAAADAQAQAIDLLFVVDESASMDREHAFLEGFVSRLDDNLEEASFTDRRYGLFGFGGYYDSPPFYLSPRRHTAHTAEEIGRSFSFPGSGCVNLDEDGFCSSHTKSWATRDEFLDEVFTPVFNSRNRVIRNHALVVEGGEEDGWAALANSLPVYWDEQEDENRGPNRARIVVLVTDEQRHAPVNSIGEFTREDARMALDEVGASLTAILNYNGFPTTEHVLNTHQLVASNGETVFTLAQSIPSTEPLIETLDTLDYDPSIEPPAGDPGNAFEPDASLSYEDYGQLVYPFPQSEDFTPEGCIADLNVLRRGGAYEMAFADIMLECILFQAEALVVPEEEPESMPMEEVPPTEEEVPPTEEEVPPTMEEIPPTMEMILLPMPMMPTDTLLFLNVYRDTAEIMMRSALGQITMGQTTDGLQDSPEYLLEVEDHLLEVPGLRGYLSLRNLDGDFQRGANNKPFDYDGWSVLFGTDHTRVDSKTATETSAGVALSFHSIDTHVRGRFGPAAQEGEPLSSDTLGTLAAEGKSITAYAVRRSESDGYWKAQVHLSANDYRQVRLDDEGEIYRARPDGLSLKARLERGWKTERELNDDRNSTLHLMPFAAIEASHYEINNFLEDNDGVAVGTFDDDRIALQVGTEVLLNRSHGGLDTFFSVRVMAEVDVFGDEEMPTLVTFDRGAGTTYVDPYEELDGQRLSVALSTGVKLRDDAHAYLRYVGDYSSHDSQRGIEAGLTVRF